MNLVVAVDKNWGIGKDNKLLYRVPEDMNFFKEITIGNYIVMGRKTFESFPNKQPLKDRTNIVLSTKIDNNNDQSDLIYMSNYKDVFNIKTEKEIFIIGGALIYELYLIHCNYAYITKINSEEIVPDTYFHNIEKLNWKLVEKIKSGISVKGYEYEILKYKNPTQNY